MGTHRQVKPKGTWRENTPVGLKEINEQLREFPNLHFSVGDGSVVVFGTLALIHEGKEFDRYSIEMHLDVNHPFAPPRVFEVAGRIPRTANRHTYADGALCLGVLEEIWPKPGNKIELRDFLNVHVRNYLIANTLVESGQPWRFGERSHNYHGILEYYFENYGVREPAQVLCMIDYALKPRPRGHWDCFCGSGKRMRNCHPSELRNLQENVVPEVLMRSGKNIYDAVLGKKEKGAKDDIGKS